MKTTQTWKIGDCLRLHPEIPDKSIDMILTDLPYGSTSCDWDCLIDLKKLWIDYKRLIKDNGVIILTAAQPFTSVLICSNLKMYKYNLVWVKTNPNGIGYADFRPMSYHEDICIFGNGRTTYNKQPIKRESVRIKQAQKNGYIFHNSTSLQTNGLNYKEFDASEYDADFKNPGTVIYFNSLRPNSIEFIPHPTQKPLLLWEYLIKTYSNEGDLILDSCLGSGTTLEACMNLNRNCIGFELKDDWVEYYRKRLKLDNTKLDAWTT